MTQFQSALKSTSSKDTNGHRTLFDCNQFRVPKPSSTTVENQADAGEPSESFVTRKRPMQQELTTTTVVPPK